MSGQATAQEKADTAGKDEFLSEASEAIRQGDWASLEEVCVKYAATHNHCAEVDFLRALAAFAEEDFVDALTLAEAAFEWDSNVQEFAEFLAIINILLGDINRSVYYAKLATALPSSEKIKALLPDTLPRYSEKFFQVEETPLLKRAFAAASLGNWADSEHWFRQQIAYDMTEVEAYRGLVNCLFIQGRFRDAAEVLRGARHVAPDDADLASMLGRALTEIGSYSEGQACHRAAISLSNQDAEIAAHAITDLWANPEEDPAAITAAFDQWGQTYSSVLTESSSARPPEDKETLIIGYLVGPTARRRNSPYLADILSHHKQDRFLCIGFGYGSLTNKENIPFQKCFDTWHDIRGMDPITFGSMVGAERVDILVDLCGFTRPDLLIAFGQRLAPLQISAFGAPSGTGLACMDALLTDAFVNRDGGEADACRLKRFNLEHGSIIAGLPEDEPLSDQEEQETGGFVFAADASQGEINPATVELWARVLREVPESTLVLMDHDFRDEGSAANLVNLFGDFGLSHRVDIVSAENSLELFQGADVCLTPIQSMRHEVVVDALWAGVPVVCFAGSGMHSRLPGSILHFAGLADDMVAESSDDFVAKAVSWAEDAARRMQLAEGIREKLKSAPLFDAKVRVQNLEAAFESLWSEACGKGDS